MQEGCLLLETSPLFMLPLNWRCCWPLLLLLLLPLPLHLVLLLLLLFLAWHWFIPSLVLWGWGWGRWRSVLLPRNVNCLASLASCLILSSSINWLAFVAAEVLVDAVDELVITFGGDAVASLATSLSAIELICCCCCWWWWWKQLTRLSLTKEFSIELSSSSPMVLVSSR